MREGLVRSLGACRPSIASRKIWSGWLVPSVGDLTDKNLARAIRNQVCHTSEVFGKECSSKQL